MMPIARSGGLVAGLALALALTAPAGWAQAVPEQPPLPEEVVGVVWEWVSFITPKEQIEVDEPERYTIELAEDGSVALQVDCNRGISTYTTAPDNRISFSPVGATMMLCPEDSLAQRFSIELERVATFALFDGDLLLELPVDSGTLRFRRAEGE